MCKCHIHRFHYILIFTQSNKSVLFSISNSLGLGPTEESWWGSIFEEGTPFRSVTSVLGEGLSGGGSK